MKKFLSRLSLAATVTFLSLALGPAARARQADQYPAPAASEQPDAAAAQQQNEAQMPTSGDTTTHEVRAFTGRIVKENGELMLQDTVTKVSYKLEDPAKAKQYVGEQVKVTGTLDMNSNTIRMNGIKPLS
jgi:Protein of unknown function (DUF5818)